MRDLISLLSGEVSMVASVPPPGCQEHCRTLMRVHVNKVGFREETGESSSELLVPFIGLPTVFSGHSSTSPTKIQLSSLWLSPWSS